MVQTNESLVLALRLLYIFCQQKCLTHQKYKWSQESLCVVPQKTLSRLSCFSNQLLKLFYSLTLNQTYNVDTIQSFNVVKYCTIQTAYITYNS